MNDADKATFDGLMKNPAHTKVPFIVLADGCNNAVCAGNLRSVVGTINDLTGWRTGIGGGYDEAGTYSTSGQSIANAMPQITGEGYSTLTCVPAEHHLYLPSAHGERSATPGVFAPSGNGACVIALADASPYSSSVATQHNTLSSALLTLRGKCEETVTAYKLPCQTPVNEIISNSDSVPTTLLENCPNEHLMPNNTKGVVNRLVAWVKGLFVADSTKAAAAVAPACVLDGSGPNVNPTDPIVPCTGGTVVNGVCTCSANQTLVNGVCTCPAGQTLVNGTCTSSGGNAGKPTPVPTTGAPALLALSALLPWLARRRQRKAADKTGGTQG